MFLASYFAFGYIPISTGSISEALLLKTNGQCARVVGQIAAMTAMFPNFTLPELMYAVSGKPEYLNPEKPTAEPGIAPIAERQPSPSMLKEMKSRCMARTVTSLALKFDLTKTVVSKILLFIACKARAELQHNGEFVLHKVAKISKKVRKGRKPYYKRNFMGKLVKVNGTRDKTILEGTVMEAMRKAVL